MDFKIGDINNITKLQLDIKHLTKTVVLEEMVNLKVVKEKSIGNFPEKIYVDVVRFDGVWSSGKKLIGEVSTLFEVLLVENCSNSFEITVYDAELNKLECQPNQFSIFQGEWLNFDCALPYSLGIFKYSKATQKLQFYSVPGLESNGGYLPRKSEIIFKTRNNIRSGMKNDKIRIPIYKREYDDLLVFITEIIITGEKFPSILPLGNDVNIKIEVDRFGIIMKFSIYIPFVDYMEVIEINLSENQSNELLE